MKRFLPWILVGFCFVCLAGGLRVPKPKTEFDSNEFGRLPVLVNGRIKPLDTLARSSLLIIRGKQSFKTEDGRQLQPIEWLMDVLLYPTRADKYKIFIITNPDVLSLFGWDNSRGKYFSHAQLEPFFKEIERQANLAEPIESRVRTVFQKEILKLRDRLLLYHRLKNSLHNDESVKFADELVMYREAIEPGLAALQSKQAGKSHNKEHVRLMMDLIDRYESLARVAYIHPIPKKLDQDWQNIGQSLLETMNTGTIDPAVTFYAAMIGEYRKPDGQAFNQTVANYRAFLDSNHGRFLKKTDYEFRFNHFEPFYRCMVLYVLVFVLAWVSWLVWPTTFSRSAFYVLLIAFVIHTIGLVSRMYLQGRPPVTNLYSSAIFVGWGAVLLSIILERIYRNGIGSLTAAAMGFLTLLIAHHLSGDGDTMEMLRAVLDTNIWLATHVVVITLGYASTFLAGFLALLYILRGVFTRSLDEATAKSLSRMVYGIICFATLFSFVGTILGGIWADQSWGRFWGWDPKENGALLIVMWNAIILHSRWGGYIRERGLMVMAVFGNIVTCFSWFGVNMLGIGLHSYGFIDKAFLWLAIFVVSQLIFIALGMLPVHFWKSFGVGKRKIPGVA